MKDVFVGIQVIAVQRGSYMLTCESCSSGCMGPVLKVGAQR